MGSGADGDFHETTAEREDRLRAERGPVKTTKDQVEKALVEALQGILGSGITQVALHDHKFMSIDDVVLNLHLYERLGTAFAAVGALKGYKDKPRGYEIVR